MKKCVVCGKEFTPTGRVQYCCSKKCSAIQKARKERDERNKRGRVIVKKTCSVCGREFVKTGNRQECCSKECACKRHAAQRLARDRAATAAKAVTMNCQICGRSFVKKTSNQMFCCIQCKRKHDRMAERDRLTKNNTSQKKCEAVLRKSEPRLCKCSNCGKVFLVVGGNFRYCESCRAKGFGKSRETSKDGIVMGLTYEERRDVAYQQDRLSQADLFKASQSWNPNQRKYALARWKQLHGV